MADITKCSNAICPLQVKCYRQTASDDRYQSYSEFAPDEDGNCEYFIANEYESKSPTMDIKDFLKSLEKETK